MKNSRIWMLAGVSALSIIANVSYAQTAPATEATNASDETVVVVTARRKSENLQNVPTTVSAVTGDTVKKLALTQFQDVAAVVPGLSLGTGTVTAGRSPAPSIRGVSYDASTQASPTVDIYQNDVPIDGSQAFQAIYDLQGIEVIRGPQGTVRGRTAPSGAMTLTTRKADTHRYGGYISALASDHDAQNIQGAVNIPVVKEILGLRIAGVKDKNRGDFVRSVNNSSEPLKDTTSSRINLYFTPTSTFDVNVTYQDLDVENRQFTAVSGNGAPGGTSALAPAGYNGPTITASQRLGVTDDARLSNNNFTLLTTQVNWTVLGQRISYIGGRTRNKSSTRSDIDYGNWILDQGFYQDLNSKSEQTTHELRLASTGTDRTFDYTIGYFYLTSENTTAGTQPASFLAGAFGSPANPANPSIFDTRYLLPTLIDVHNQSTEKSIYGNLVWHLSKKTEVSAGIRHIVSDVDNVQVINLGAGMIARSIGIPCAFANFASTYGGGYCDIPIAASTTPIQNSTLKNRKQPTVYNLSVSHRFSDQILSYATYATSWRRGANNISLSNADNDPTLASLTFLPDETSRSFEAGMKTNWLDKRLRLNAAVFTQKFDGLLFQVPSIPYVGSNGSTTSVLISTVNVGADSIVNGIDFDGAFQVTPNWSVSGSFSYADGKVDNDAVPCRDGNFDGTPDSTVATLAQFQAAGVYMAYCNTKQAVSREPMWNSTLQSEYWHPVGDMQAYVRGLATYYTENDRRNLNYTVPSYTMVNLYAGVRAEDSSWDLNFYVRNLFDKGVVTSLDPDATPSAANATAFFGSSGYYFTSYTPPREVGISLRYAFGSR